MTRIVKLVFSSGIVSMGLLTSTVTLTGCSGESTKSIEEVKINGMTPGEYRDSVDPEVKRTKGAKGAARPKR